MNLNPLRRQRRPPLRPLEQQLLEALSRALPPEAQLLLSQQMAQVNLVQRHTDGKEVNLYRLRRRRPTFDETVRFPNTVPEAELARISFRVPDVAGVFRVGFWIVEGFLFSLRSRQSPRAIKDATVQIGEVKLLADPMAAAPASRTPLAPGTLRGWLREWTAQWPVGGLAEPLPAAERQERARAIEATLPADYLEIIPQTEGLQIDGWTIHGLMGIRTVVLPDASYYVLAENEARGVLGVKEGGAQGRLHFYGNEGKEEELGSSLRAALEQLMCGRGDDSR